MPQREIVVDPYCRDHGWSSYWYPEGGRGTGDVVRRPYGTPSSHVVNFVVWSGDDDDYVIHEENFERAGIDATPR